MRAAVALLFVVVAAGTVVAPGNGASRRLNPHEILVAQTATEMQQRGDLLIPYYNGSIRLEKPPLSYWSSMLAQRVLGIPSTQRVSELEARSPSLVAGMLLLLVTFAIGVAAFDDRRVGLVATAVLATTWDFFTYSRSARPEMAYTLFCNLQVLGFTLAIRSARKGESTWRGALLAWASMAAALLAKGPQLPAFFLAGTSIVLIAERPRVALGRTLHVTAGTMLVAAVVLPYFAYVASETHGALGFWAAQMVQDKPVPLWLRPLRLYYPAAIVVGLAPWIVALGLAARGVWRRRHPSAVMLAACILVMLVCLSFAGKLRQHYVLPATPLCAVLAGAALVDFRNELRDGSVSARALRKLASTHAAITVIALLGIALLSLRPHAVSGEPMWPGALPFVVVGLVAVWAGMRAVPDRLASGFVAFVCALFAGWAAISVAGIDSGSRWADAASFAEAVDRKLSPGEAIYLEAGVEESLVYYGRRRVIRSNARHWLADNPAGRVPYFVCEERCREVEGRAIIRQRGAASKDAMVLVRPRRAAGAPGPDSESASRDPAESPR
jgi:4-amino-4-deoxy-L-arabinose transferase-like glycosyltransferase